MSSVGSSAVAAISKSWAVIGNRRSGNSNAKVNVYKHRPPFFLSISQATVQGTYVAIITHAASSHHLRINDVVTISGFIAGGFDHLYPGCVKTTANGNCGENRFRPMNQKFRVMELMSPTTTKLTLRSLGNSMSQSYEDASLYDARARINMSPGTWNECDPVVGCVGSVSPSPWGAMLAPLYGQFMGTWPEFTLSQNENDYGFGKAVAVTDRTIMAASCTTG